MGTGNIIGVAAALCIGGPGAVFWMWFSALLGMALTYSEKRPCPALCPDTAGRQTSERSHGISPVRTAQPGTGGVLCCLLCCRIPRHGQHDPEQRHFHSGKAGVFPCRRCGRRLALQYCWASFCSVAQAAPERSSSGSCRCCLPCTCWRRSA